MKRHEHARPGGWGRTFRLLLFPALVVLGLLVGHAGPGVLSKLPACQVHQLTGLHCPGCGGTRAVQALAHGDLIGALRLNAFGTGLTLAVALMTLRLCLQAAWPARTWPGRPFGDRFGWGLLAMLVLFTVLRNLPWWPFTLLAPA